MMPDAVRDSAIRIAVPGDCSAEPRVIESGNHPYSVATLYVPQVQSTPDRPHPLIAEFARAAAAAARKVTPS